MKDKNKFIFGIGEIRKKEEWNALYEEMMSDLYKAVSEKNKKEKEEEDI